MGRKFILPAVAGLLLLLLPSCNVSKRSAYQVESNRFNLDMSSLNYLGDSKVCVDYSTIIGFRHITKINGVQYDGKRIVTSYPSMAAPFKNAVLSRALPAIYDSYPDAEFIIVSNETHSKEATFLGAQHKVEAKVKVYTFNNKK